MLYFCNQVSNKDIKNMENEKQNRPNIREIFRRMEPGDTVEIQRWPDSQDGFDPEYVRQTAAKIGNIFRRNFSVSAKREMDTIRVTRVS